MAFPTMLVRPGTAIKWAGHRLDSRTVHSEEEEAAARKDGWLEASELLNPKPAKRDPLDHDGDGAKGGSLPGAKSTAAKGKRKKGK